jgi:DMSO/TMAO reductase YedYZ molybdopterin-dependent catalytic subunit
MLQRGGCIPTQGPTSIPATASAPTTTQSASTISRQHEHDERCGLHCSTNAAAPSTPIEHLGASASEGTAASTTHAAGSHDDNGHQQRQWQGFTLSDVLAVHESKSFDYRVSVLQGAK